MALMRWADAFLASGVKAAACLLFSCVFLAS
jgi:hypothetical protein